MRGKQLKQDWQGPTAERIAQTAESGAMLEEGKDDRGATIPWRAISSLATIYGRLKRNARDDKQRRISEGEERALERYHDSYIGGGMGGSIGSSDFNGAGGVNPASRDHTAKNDHQIDCRDDIAAANQAMTTNQKRVVECVVLFEWSLVATGRAMGKTSDTRAQQSAEKLLREAGSVLADLWKY
jgi:hypothetical protein